MHVLRVYHGGRDHSAHARERALVEAGADVTLVMPSAWPGDDLAHPTSEKYAIRELDVHRSGDVNRHSYRDTTEMHRLLREISPDLLDLHEEPFSVAGRQWLTSAPRGLPVVMYTAQNVDKRYPPPFALYERQAHRRVAALYPCSRQAASVARGKGFDGLLEVVPLGYDPLLFHEGLQSPNDSEFVLGLFGRLVPEKGIRDAVRVLGRLNADRPTRLLIVGSGPEMRPALELARSLGLVDRIEFVPWQPVSELATIYRRAHVTLVPSTPTATWTEQFGRVIVEAHASGSVVAGYATGAIAEVAEGSALLVEPGDASRLAEEIVGLLHDPHGYKALREHGLALSASRTWGKVAAMQVRLYERVIDGGPGKVDLPGSPRRRREMARQEFGPTASTTAGTRPFAVPILRRGGAISAVLAATIDFGAELAARFGGR